MDERDVEQVLRAGLAGHAERADVTAPVAARARAAVAHRHRTRWGVVAAAAAVVLVIGGAAVLTRGGDDRAAEPPGVADSGTTVADPPAGWRTEYYGGVAVDVPAAWGYGGAPLPSQPLTVCAPGGPPGYVGRPIVQTDVCTYLRSGWQPTAPYVWLGAALAPGTEEWDNGYVQETVEVAGTTVTVGTADAHLRAQVLATVRPGDLCDATLDAVPSGHLDLSREGTGTPRPSTLCAYRRDASGELVLAYGRRIAGRALAESLEAVSTAPASEAKCDVDELVVLTGDFDDRYGGGPASQHQELMVAPDCGYVDIGGAPRKLTDAAVHPWADPGVRATLFYFIGPQG
ncbi:hypothetical protein [Nocardioides sp. MH1]|uniref:hypothetical protein n=1 Tax=Nocardioides sp. MH1 TaxID=3242490 RepID=UPI00351FEF0C